MTAARPLPALVRSTGIEDASTPPLASTDADADATIDVDSAAMDRTRPLRLLLLQPPTSRVSPKDCRGKEARSESARLRWAKVIQAQGLDF